MMLNPPAERSVVKALVLSGEPTVGKDDVVSRADDPFAGLSQSLYVLPPFDLMTLSRLVDMNAALRGCIDAMETNIAGFGYRTIPRVRTGVTPEVEAEVERLTGFLNGAGMAIDGSRISFRALRKRTRRDLETTGNAYWEIVRDARGRIRMFRQLPSHQIRLAPTDQVPFRVEAVAVSLADGKPALETQSVFRQFRRYIQGFAGVGSISQRYFKQFGDPRKYDCRTGELATPDMEVVHEAGEIFHWSLFNLWHPYGCPRWMSAILSVMGCRSAQEVNYTTLRNNNIPSMAITVSNGRLTEPSILRIKQFLETNVQGKSNYSQFLLIEGESGLEGDETSQAKIDFKPLTAAQHVDELFKNYQTSAKSDIRQAFRLPGLFVGDDNGNEKSTAELLRRLTDEQVFAPERDEDDWQINEVFLPACGFALAKTISRTPNVTDNTELIQMLATAERTGGNTPRIARTLMEDLFPEVADMPPLDPSINPDVPFSLTMAERLKNQSDPTELNQQVAPTQPPIDPVKRAQKALDPDDEAGLFDAMLDLGSSLGARLRNGP